MTGILPLRLVIVWPTVACQGLEIDDEVNSNRQKAVMDLRKAASCSPWIVLNTTTKGLGQGVYMFSICFEAQIKGLGQTIIKHNTPYHCCIVYG